MHASVADRRSENGALSRASRTERIDQVPVEVAWFAEFMYGHIGQAAEVGDARAEWFLIEGFALSAAYPPRLQAIGRVWIRACFLANCIS